ncbi:hypothetical protein PG984_010087 [Apiospora sp. TS-2023a]
MENGKHQPQRDMSHPHHPLPSPSTKSAGEKPSSFSGNMEYSQIRFPFFNKDGSTDISMSDVSDRDSDPNEDQTEEHTALKCHDCGAILHEISTKKSTPPVLGGHGQVPTVGLESSSGATEGLSDLSSSPPAKETDAHVTGESKSSATRDSQAALNTSPPRKSTSQTTQILEEEEKSRESPVTHPATNKSVPTTKDPSGTPKTSTANEQYCRQCGNFQPKSEFRNQQHPSLETKNCSSCREKVRDQKRRRYEERTREPGMVVCTHCTQSRPEADFEGGPAGRWRQCVTCRTWSHKRRDKTAPAKEEKKDKQRHSGKASGNDSPDSSSSSSSSPSKGTRDLGESQPVAPGTVASTLASSLLSKVVAAKRARLARGEEATRGDETKDAARGAVYDAPLARMNPSVAVSTDKGGEASKASTATTTITPRIDYTTPLDLRGGWLPDSPPTKSLRRQQVPDTATTAATTAPSTYVSAATTTTFDTSSDSTAPAEVAMSLAESEPWNTPYDASMPISEEIFSMYRAYLLGLETADQLIGVHGTSAFFSQRRFIVEYVGLVIPGLQQAVFSDQEMCVRLRSALLRRQESPQSLTRDQMRLLDRLEEDHPAFASLLRDGEVAYRFVHGLDWHMEYLRRQESARRMEEKKDEIKKLMAENREKKKKKESDGMMKFDNVDSDVDVDLTDWVWVVVRAR